MLAERGHNQQQHQLSQKVSEDKQQASSVYRRETSKVAPKDTEQQPSCAAPLPPAPAAHPTTPRPASAAAAPSAQLLDRGNARRHLTAAATQPHQHSETRAARAPPPGTLPLHYKRLQGRGIVHLTCRHGLYQLCTPAPPPVTLALPSALKPLCAERFESTLREAGLLDVLFDHPGPWGDSP